MPGTLAVIDFMALLGLLVLGQQIIAALQKITPLLADLGARQGSAQEVFVRINKGLRKENEDRITAITSKGTPSILWKGAFTQLSNSKVEANFADERTYTWDKEAVSDAFHLGFDLVHHGGGQRFARRT